MKIQVDPERTYANARADAYPNLRDQVDAIMKGFSALRADGVSLPPETVAWIDRCQAVKAKFPKEPK